MSVDFSKVTEIEIPVNGQSRSVEKIVDSDGNVIWQAKVTVTYDLNLDDTSE